MSDVVGIKFQICGKVYDFEAKDIEIGRDELVVVESDLGLSIGRVVYKMPQSEAPKRQLKPVLRKAGEDDLLQEKENTLLEAEARAYCIERIMARGLPMKLVDTDVTLDRKRLLFYFVANTRIDFRELVKDLAAKFKTRIEMRQIGVRDEAKTIGSFGICGRDLCCRSFLTSFEPISIKMAKKQELALNTSKLSGACGRLMCCLSFEYGEPPRTLAKEQEYAPQAEDSLPITENSVEPLSSAEIEARPSITSNENKTMPAEEKQALPSSGKDPLTQANETGTTSLFRKRRKRNRWRKIKKQ